MVERPYSSACIREVLRQLKSSKAVYERAYDKALNKGLHDLYGALASTHVPMIADLEVELAHHEMRVADRTVGVRMNWGGLFKEMRGSALLLGYDGVLHMVHSTERRLLSVYDRHLLDPDLPSATADLLGRHRSQIFANVKDIEFFLACSTSFA